MEFNIKYTLSEEEATQIYILKHLLTLKGKTFQDLIANEQVQFSSKTPGVQSKVTKGATRRSKKGAKTELFMNVLRENKNKPLYLYELAEKAGTKKNDAVSWYYSSGRAITGITKAGMSQIVYAGE